MRVSRWAWLERGASPRVDHVPAAVRRRLSPLARCAFDVLARVLQPDAPASPAEQVPLVFASRNGEVVSLHTMLTELAHAQPLSPTLFSHSVHNAIAGQSSIVRHDEHEVRAVAGGADSAAAGFIEAAGLIAEGAERVAVLVCDEALPDEWKPFLPELDAPCAFAAVLERGVLERGAPTLTLEAAARHGQSTTGTIDAVVSLLSNQAQHVYTRGERGDWLWRRSA